MVDNPFARELADWMERKAKVEGVRLEWGGKHPKLRWRSLSSQVERFYVCAASPSDHRARKNLRADIKRRLMEDGDWLEPTVEELTEARAKREADRKAAIARQIEFYRQKADELEARM